MQPSHVSGTNFRTAFVLLLVLAVSVLFLAVAWPFLKPLLLGALLAGLCSRFIAGSRVCSAVASRWPLHSRS